MIRPSLLPTIALCPGAYQASRDLPDPDSKWSEMGTNLHVGIAEMMKAQMSAESVTEFYHWINNAGLFIIGERIARRLYQTFIVGRQYPFTVDYEVDTEVNGYVSAGHADIVITDDTYIDVIDIKTGHNEVDPAHRNLQLIAYGLSFYRIHGMPVFIHIIRHNGWIDSELIDGTNCDVLDEHMQKIAGDALHVLGAPQVPHPEACRYCPAFGLKQCQPSRDIMEHIKRLPIEEQQNRKELGEILGFNAAISNAADRAKEVIKNDYNQGLAPVGSYRVSKPRKNRFISNNLKAIEAMHNLGLSNHQIAEGCDISTTKIKAIMIRDLGCVEEEAEARLFDALQKYEAIEEVDGNPSVTYIKPKQ